MSKQAATLHNESCAQALFARVPGGVAQWHERRLFGGVCLDGPEGLFCIVFEGRMFLRVDEVARARHERAGAPPFQPYGGRAMRSYYEVPAEVLADGAQLRLWMQRSAALTRPQAAH
ncbi:MAG: TfoX/Sxy family protein [Solimonas sp.]